MHISNWQKLGNMIINSRVWQISTFMLQMVAGIITNSSEDVSAFSIWTPTDSALSFLSWCLGYLQNNLSLLLDLGSYNCTSEMPLLTSPSLTHLCCIFSSYLSLRDILSYTHVFFIVYIFLNVHKKDFVLFIDKSTTSRMVLGIWY